MSSAARATADQLTPPGGAANRLVAGDVRGRWRDLPDLDLPAKCAALVDGHSEAATVTWAHVRSGGELLLAGASRLSQDEVSALSGEGFAVRRHGRVQRPQREAASVTGRIWLLTSGTTGRPKRVAHSLASLTTVAGAQPPRVWLCPYLPGTYAWWQVVTLSLTQPHQDLVFAEPEQLADWPELALREGVTAVSGTPTFWRQALLHAGDVVARLPLSQVTLGGEPVDQAVLSRLRQVFPSARISWIYASSEAGASIVVHDGEAGFPASWLDRAAPGRPLLRVVDGELLVDSGRSADGIRGLLRTGDRAEVVGDRVHLTGRIAEDEINVGGAKVSAGSVRAALLEHPAVAWAQARGRRAPLVGQVVVADVVLTAPVTDADLVAWCAERLPEYAVPRRVRVLEEIPMKESLKSDGTQ